MLKRTGIPTPEDINGVFPSEERLNKGAVAVIECYEEIPCNPCYTSCKIGALKPFNDISDLPNLNHEECTGCAVCLSKCPGLAIMIVDTTYSETEALLKIPYEFRPLPNEGDMVKALDREGKFVTDVKVVKVLNPKSFDKTPIVSIAVPQDKIRVIRNIQIGGV